MPTQPDLIPGLAAPPAPWPTAHLRVVRIGEPLPPERIDQPIQSHGYWFRHVAAHPFFDSAKEHLAVILLNTKLATIGWNLVAIGSLNEAIAHPREIFRPAIAAAAYGFVLMHNHPSGDSTPSDADRRLTNRIREAATLLSMSFLDHVIVGAAPSDHPFSFRESGIL